jgi:hypothetical protein
MEWPTEARSHYMAKHHRISVPTRPLMPRKMPMARDAILRLRASLGLHTGLKLGSGYRRSAIQGFGEPLSLEKCLEAWSGSP